MTQDSVPLTCTTIMSWNLHLGLPSSLFPLVSHQNPAGISFAVRVTYPANLTLLRLIILILLAYANCRLYVRCCGHWPSGHGSEA
jgi:hypothetical protein